VNKNAAGKDTKLKGSRTSRAGQNGKRNIESRAERLNFRLTKKKGEICSRPSFRLFSSYEPYFL